ncbi:LacI family DNA-binding transcriptional regulator [Phyllobacterium sp. 0TCS1.6C]|uniref:LacI family DNA-binding transcriptional regulator n=1 Tax=unclassified Phyllobacterium TaxID=2638441 RepID=UPI0022650A31|nr:MULTISPECIES: LacI family DNA-binding transcriptional regulator [unclassified Phyllobacterium]MCX8282039.1 LacI family DNA-binding transcriptional regulator [Phyllobacterium sp. 0TCS1.6C]MCX8296269.1 LacI family DNA-binding transcriptional regulator [Phyllobacterium sp. 0TCS1.6A]
MRSSFKDRKNIPTLASIAERVGVSVNTVSRALRAPNTVRTELRNRINAAMDELNYVPNRLAGGLSGTHSDIVGVVVTSLYYSEFASIIDTLQSCLLEHDLQVMLANTRYDADQELRLVRSILSWRPAAVAIIGVDHPPKVAELLMASGIPIIEMWDTSGPVIDTAVGFDHAQVGAAQAEHLIAEGYRRLAFLGSVRENDLRAQKRLKGVKAAAAAAGLPELVTHTAQQGGSPVLGERLAIELMEQHPDIDGIVCNSDVVGFGVLRALKTLGKQVPNDVGLIAFGDNEAARYLTPSLTTIRPDREQIGKATAAAIIARINGSEPGTTRVNWSLEKRESTRRQNDFFTGRER